MKLLFPKLFVTIACVFLLAHNLIAHHHNDPIEITQHHHDDDHSIFSFGQLDDNFITTNGQISVTPDFVSQLFLLPNITLLTDISFTEKHTECGMYEEFPPPENYNCSASLRAPPVFIG
ncbi:MAG: hypothetical protein HY840_03280 [Bacteroidetes bacterium]|nr:hypothetical protein [Bacteroidota bacterium]